MITGIVVNFNSYDFLGLLIESFYLFCQNSYELIVIDNSEQRVRLDHPHVTQFFMPRNIGHGKGLNLGVTKALELFPKHPYLMFLDSDCHLLSPRWEAAFIEQMRTYDIIGGKGPPSKPIRPACIFMKKEMGRYDWAESEGHKGNRVTPGGYDVAIKAYYKIMADNRKIGFLQAKENRYGTLNGEEWCINGEPFVYHHWHGSTLKERATDFPDNDLMEDKAKLFSKIPWHLP
jgi:glycosyltransferase involved in cell wall biosynthesis